MKHIALIGLIAFLFAGCDEKEKTGETLLALQSGGNGNVSYGLFHAVTHSRSKGLADCDLVLVLRNYGAKFVNMSNVTAEDITVQDSRGTNVIFTLAASPKSMKLGESTIIHLRVKPSAENSQPWILKFKAKGAEYVTDLSLTDIRF